MHGAVGGRGGGGGGVGVAGEMWLPCAANTAKLHPEKVTEEVQALQGFIELQQVPRLLQRHCYVHGAEGEGGGGGVAGEMWLPCASNAAKSHLEKVPGEVQALLGLIELPRLLQRQCAVHWPEGGEGGGGGAGEFWLPSASNAAKSHLEKVPGEVQALQGLIELQQLPQGCCRGIAQRIVRQREFQEVGTVSGCQHGGDGNSGRVGDAAILQSQRSHPLTSCCMHRFVSHSRRVWPAESSISIDDGSARSRARAWGGGGGVGWGIRRFFLLAPMSGCESGKGLQSKVCNLTYDRHDNEVVAHLKISIHLLRYGFASACIGSMMTQEHGAFHIYMAFTKGLSQAPH